MEISCGIYLYSTQINRVLIGHVTNHNQWSIPKGHFEKSDGNFYNAAIRELWEETNININDLSVLDTHEFDFTFYRSGRKKLKSFLIVFNSPIEYLNVRCNSFFKERGIEYPEFDTYKWIKIESLQKYVHPTQHQNIKKIKNFIY
jgi:8-oxo-dGTP pyrophosphatase MutT (NUDIX family)